MKTFDIQTKILIAGAGPAGAATSLFLSKENIPHVIIDRATFPRDKICGDALSGKVLDVFKKLDEKISEEIFSEKKKYLGSYGVKFAAPDGNFIDIPFKKDISHLAHPPGFISKRIHFDNFLFKKIDKRVATVFENCLLKTIKRVEGGIVCSVEHNGKTLNIFSKIIIGAEGDRSLVAKQLAGIKKEDEHYCAGLRCYYKGVKNMHEQSFIELHFLKELLPGYLWIFPLPNGEANVGVGMLSSVAGKKKINLRKVMLEAIKTNPTINSRFADAELIGEIKGWGLPLGSKKRKISGTHFLLTGDAASLIDPFTGEGIGNAMLSGMIAAQQCKRAIEENKFDETFLSAYDIEVYSSLGKELKLSRTMQQLSKHGRLFNFVVNKASHNAELKNILTGMFEDLDMRKKLSSPGFYFRLLFR